VPAIIKLGLKGVKQHDVTELEQLGLLYGLLFFKFQTAT
jgi:hypothetical protein